VPDLAFAQFHACRWGLTEGSWLPAGAWQACVGAPVFEDGEPVWVGVDVGGDRSASAVVWVNAGLHVGCAIYHGDGGVLECVEQVRKIAGQYRVREAVFDSMRHAIAFGVAQCALAPLEASRRPGRTRGLDWPHGAGYSRDVDREKVGRVLAALQPRDRKVIEMRFGLTGGPLHTLQEVGDAFHLTREQIREIEGHAVRLLDEPEPT